MVTAGPGDQISSGTYTVPVPVWTGGRQGVQANGTTESGDLSVSRSDTVDVPVSESQALVRRVG